MSKFHDDKSRDVLGCDGLLHCVHQERMYSQVPDKDLDMQMHKGMLFVLIIRFFFFFAKAQFRESAPISRPVEFR
jgi:hypothetical protein